MKTNIAAIMIHVGWVRRAIEKTVATGGTKASARTSPAAVAARTADAAEAPDSAPASVPDSAVDGPRKGTSGTRSFPG
ncbi:hypothetical protein GCM10009569_02190 [Arthrobacter russicus]